MKRWKPEQIEFVVYTIGLFIVGYINIKWVYAVYIILIIIYFVIKNYITNKRQ